MKQIVRTGNHNSLNVTPNNLPASLKLTFLDIKIVIIIVNKIAVPVCPIIFKVNTNGLCVTSLTVPGKLNLNTNDDKAPFGKNKFLKNGALQIITMTVNTMNGLHACNTAFAECAFAGSISSSLLTR
ncbi:Uncharacterised protein [Staphylococcus aureus]|nr:Uncharacterised protein [Staphylococcus aureus]